MLTKEISGEEAQSPPMGTETQQEELNRDNLLQMLTVILKSQHKQALGGRIRDEKKFKLRLDAVRVYAYVASVYGSILKDKDLSEILKRLEVLESNAKQ
jgi:hypothetical protein